LMDLFEARRLVDGYAVRLPVESVRLEEALGRALAGDIFSDRRIPSEARSRFDGFAVRSEDTPGAATGVSSGLGILPGVVAAGSSPHSRVGKGECIGVLTGAPIPDGSDSVVRQEDTVRTDDRLHLKRAHHHGEGITEAGEDLDAGELVLSDGDLLTPTRLALAGALGLDRISVYRRPTIALLATGDEVRELGTPLEGPATYCNNRHLLAWLAAVHGATPVHLGIAADNPFSIREKIQGVESEMIVSTGGMGHGERDYALEAWRMLDVTAVFSEINLSPGKRSAFGVRGKQMYWGLPGIPWAARIVFEELISPAIRKLQGIRAEVTCFSAIIEDHVKKKPGFYKAIRGTLKVDSTPPVFVPMREKGASRFEALRRNFAYILLEPDVVEVRPGSPVKVRLHDFPLLASALLGRG
jgi:molybdopterin molybdotransferase